MAAGLRPEDQTFCTVASTDATAIWRLAIPGKRQARGGGQPAAAACRRMRALAGLGATPALARRGLAAERSACQKLVCGRGAVRFVVQRAAVSTPGTRRHSGQGRQLRTPVPRPQLLKATVPAPEAVDVMGRRDAHAGERAAPGR
jgi:hypothetical protein